MLKGKLFLAVLCLSLLPTVPVRAQTDMNAALTDMVASTWGDKVALTCLLTRDQTFGEVFGSDLTVADMAAQWQKNFNTGKGALSPATAQSVSDALESLVAAIKRDPSIQWRAWELYSVPWNALPGKTGAKQKARDSLQKLLDAGMISLTFLKRGVDENPSKEFLATMDLLVSSAALSGLTQLDLYIGTADADRYSAGDFELISYALDQVGLLRTEVPLGFGGLVAYQCCNRYTRSCVVAIGPALCGTCTGGCCLGSTYCP